MIVVTKAGAAAEPTPPPSGGGYEFPTPGEVAPLVWTWTDTRGETWFLTDWSSSAIKLRGATGIGMPTFTHLWDEGSSEGSAWQDVRAERGQLFLPLLIRAFSSQEFVDTHSAFIRGLNPRGRGTMRITRPDGSWRQVRARYESGADAPVDLDPVKFRHVQYGITWALEEPYWEGEPVERTYSYEAPAPFFPGPPWNLGKSGVLGSARITNPGDESSSAYWRVDGPFTSFSVGLGTSLVSLALVKAAGQYVAIDMDPRKKTIIDEAGTDRWAAATDLNFSRIPPGDNIPLTTTIAGPGATTAAYLRFVPRYWGALS